MGRQKMYIIIVLMFSFLMKAGAQQTIQFSQYVFNGIAVNPAYAGYRDDWTLNLSRLQIFRQPKVPLKPDTFKY